MTRQDRIDHPGLVHHLMARTFSDRILFKDDADRSIYLHCLSHGQGKPVVFALHGS